ncbi:methionyl-tRNA formyltransferase [Propionibacterium freudenreichii]|uniref:methionyl-tRNA formyltransferase n=1 Tax=Propionibacterium freudenreichii TaxID=1744 RepID=UPI0005A5CED4|nr:methionyl-tRNA formyltransferase [Propionibacterium freudenreichii]CEI29090.1 Methionyl-tRNA formyltransferase [Propionibacterium freudenreichii]
MRIVFAGTPDLAVPSLRALSRAGHEIAAVVTRPDARSGRGKQLVSSPVARAAEEMGIAVLKPEHPRDPGFADQLARLSPRACAVVAYGGLLPQSLLDLVPDGWINLHFSLLPAWRGAAPVQRALMAGDTQTGVTTFRIVKKLDAGPLYRSVRVPIGPDETAGELLDRLSVIGADVLVETFADITAGLEPVEQDDDGVSIAAKVSVDDARIDWRQPAARIVNLVRGTNPAPGAWSVLAGRHFKVLRVAPAGDTGAGTALLPGELRATNKHLWVGCGDGAVELIQVRDFGKKSMSGADWARGARPTPGIRFEAADHE